MRLHGVEMLISFKVYSIEGVLGAAGCRKMLWCNIVEFYKGGVWGRIGNMICGS